MNSNNLNNQYLECYEKKNLPYELHRGDFRGYPALGVRQSAKSQKCGKQNRFQCGSKKQDDNANRVTYDLAFVEAHGPVHTIQYLDGDTYVFDKSGNIVTFNGYDPFTADVYGQPEKLLNKFNRDSEGRICKVVGAMFDTDYTWEGKRIVKYVRGIESGLRTREYHYGAKGLIEYATNTTEYETYKDDDPTEVTRVKEVYEYKKFDKYGNWTERTVKGVTTHREITYYE